MIDLEISWERDARRIDAGRGGEYIQIIYEYTMADGRKGESRDNDMEMR
jgi:hypothetical protein